ncbi:MAG TPA: hypothetical protein PLL78_00995 [Fimbriimonadaceae bacterium]|nr:hypothetical protein [Fimbriimonadaceae bacterium]HRJ95239.1 hypothetical protein [Fimbriimonadaceae bacterium]
MNRRLFICSISVAAVGGAIGFLMAMSPDARAQIVTLKFLRLQALTPGTPDNGHANLSGMMIAERFVGGGSMLTDLDASNLMTGTVPGARLPVPMSLFLNSASDVTLTVENAAASGTALTVLGNFNVGPGGKFRVDNATGNALSQGTVTANGLFSADDTEVGGVLRVIGLADLMGDAKVGGNLDMTGGGIANIGSNGSSFNSTGDLDVRGFFSAVSPGFGSSVVLGTGTARLHGVVGVDLLSPAIIGVAAPLITLTNGVTEATFDANGLSLTGDLHLAQRFHDGSDSPGANGDLLMSTGTQTRWVNLVGADGESLIVRGDASIGGANAPRIFTLERLPSPKVTIRGLFDVMGAVCTDNSFAFKTSTGTPPTSTHIKSPANDTMTFHTMGAERFRIAPNGSVNIGTLSGPGRVNINGNLIMQGTGSIFAVDSTLASTAGAGRAYAFVNGGWGEQRSRNNLGQDVFLVTGPATGFSDGFVGASINNAGTALNAGFQRVQSTNLTHLFANGTKSFVEPNPNDPATDIYYAALEGPEAGMYVRGTGRLVGGRALITLPDHFVALADENSITVQLTPLSFDSEGLAVGAKSLAGIQVGELRGGKGSYDFDWEVKSVRRKFRDFRVLRPWDDLVLPSADRQQAWEARMQQMRSH